MQIQTNVPLSKNECVAMLGLDIVKTIEEENCNFCQEQPEFGIVRFFAEKQISNFDENDYPCGLILKAIYIQSEKSVNKYDLDDLTWNIDHFLIID